MRVALTPRLIKIFFFFMGGIPFVYSSFNKNGVQDGKHACKLGLLKSNSRRHVDIWRTGRWSKVGEIIDLEKGIFIQEGKGFFFYLLMLVRLNGLFAVYFAFSIKIAY